MAQEKESRKYINIPGSGDFIFDFKMDLTLPPPISQPKSLFYPLDPDRYTKPKLTLLHIPKKPTLYNDITLGIPVDEVNMMPELYNPEGNVQKEPSELDREILNLTLEDLRKESAAMGKKRTYEMSDEMGFYLRESQLLSKSGGTKFGKGGKPKVDEGHVSLANSYQKPETQKKALTVKSIEDLKDLVDDQFKKVQLLDTHNYLTTSKNARVKKVHQLLPNMADFLTNFDSIKVEAGHHLFKTKKIMLHEVDKEAFSLYAQSSIYDDLDIEKPSEQPKTEQKTEPAKAANKKRLSKIMDEEDEDDELENAFKDDVDDEKMDIEEKKMDIEEKKTPQKGDTDSFDEQMKEFEDFDSDHEEKKKEENGDKMDEEVEKKSQKSEDKEPNKVNPYEAMDLGYSKLDEHEKSLVSKVANYQLKGKYLFKTIDVPKMEFLIRLVRGTSAFIYKFSKVYIVKRKKTAMEEKLIDDHPEGELTKLAEVYFRGFTKEELNKGVEILARFHCKHAPVYKRLSNELKKEDFYVEAEDKDYEKIKSFMTRLKLEKDRREMPNEEQSSHRNSEDEENKDAENLDDFAEEDDRDLQEEKRMDAKAGRKEAQKSDDESEDSSFDIGAKSDDD